MNFRACEGDKMREKLLEVIAELEIVKDNPVVAGVIEKIKALTRLSHHTQYRNKEWLYRQYITEGRTMADISTDAGVTPMTIQNWLDKHEIPTRPVGTGDKPPRHRKVECVKANIEIE